MKVQVVPEDILWQYLANCLSGHPEQELPHREHFGRLPLEIDLSEEFLTRWRRTVGAAVGREVAVTFQFRPFLFLENDQVVRASPLDDHFWRQTTLVFSDRAVHRLWQDLVGRRQGKPPVWQTVTPADALFLALVDPRLVERFDFAWLHANEAPWLVVAMFLHLWKFYNPPTLPWKIYLERPDPVPLPLRELLIEHTAAFFHALAYAVHRFGQAEIDRPTTLPRPEQRRVRFFFEHAADVLRLSGGDPFSTAAIRAAVAAWTGPAALGFDDARFIEGAVEQYGLFRHIDAFLHECRTLTDICRSGGIHEQELPDQTPSRDVSDL